MTLSAAEYDVICRNDFHSFIHRAFRELNQDAVFSHNWHNELIASKLQSCLDGQITRLIINLPPRSLKSHAATICFPAFVFGHRPSAKIICASYGQDLADKHSLDCRTLMASAWYRRLFQVRLSPRKQSVKEFLTTANGSRLATSVGGPLHGRGSDFIIIDDPLKPDEAVSATRRRAVNEWYDHTLYSRQNDKCTGCLIIVMQRLHQDDLVGHVTEQEKWDWVRLPAIAEEDETHQIVSPIRSCTVRRRAGEALHPAREPLEVLEKLRRTLGEYNFAGQYQQNPAPLGGGMVKAHWFRTYVPGEEPSRFDQIVQSWDTANKSSELADFSVCTTWGVKSKKLYLLHVVRRRMEYPELKRAVIQHAERFRPTNVLIEDKASGTQLIQELIRAGVYGITRYEPTMDKVMRLHSVTSTIENGFVYLPTQAAWLTAYLDELKTFPSGKHDDQADSTSQALDWLNRGSHVYGVLECYRQQVQAERLGLPEGYQFTQCEDGEEIIAKNKTTGKEILWNGQAWVDRCSNTAAAESEHCPSCGASGVATLFGGTQKRCQQCGKQWPPAPRVQPVLTRRDILNWRKV